MKIYFYTFFLALAFCGCIEPFELEVGDYESTLVVDGIFSDGEDASTIILSRSFAYSEKEAVPVQAAVVIIEDDQGSRTQLKEAEAGVYKTDPASFKGEVGRSYRLVLKLPDGNEFESDWELMKVSPAVGEVNLVFEEKIPDDPELKPVPVAQFYLNTQDTENNTRYYRWEHEETYQYYLSYPPRIRVVFSDRPGNGADEVFNIPLAESEGYNCWKTEKSKRVIIASTENLSQDIVQDLPLHVVDETSPRLYKRYSLLIKQYAISKTYFEFLRKIEEVNETTGGLFDPIPNEIFGNVNSSNGKNIPVLGYFAVAGVSTRRIFVEQEDVPRSFITPVGPECVNDTIAYDFRTLYREMSTKDLKVYDYHYSPFGGIIGFVLSEPPCTRCAANEATNEKPVFW